MGVIYAATDTRLERNVALKLIRSAMAQGDVARERFWREARLAASVNHPHVCQLYDVGEADGQLFIAMERLEGEPLTAVLMRGPLTVSDAVRLGLELLDALGALHASGIMHRDLKPSNVFITPRGLKLLDFGLARSFDDRTTRELTRAGTLVGTPRYMAPEQLQGRPVDARTDLFAAGAVLYEMLAGRPAFDAPAIEALIDQILHGDQPVLGGSSAIGAIDRVLHRALAKAPEHRYATAAAMADDLRAIAAGASSDDQARARPVTRLAVVPFRLLRPDAEVDFLSFGLADAVATTLSPLDSLVVRAPMAAARFAGAGLDLNAIAQGLDVDAVVTGTLLRAGPRLRVSTQLLEAPSGTVLWAGTAEAELGDLFQLQDDLARRIVQSLALPLSSGERRAPDRAVPANATAYEFYLRGNQLSHERATWPLARDLYEQAVRADPQFAPGWARLGRMLRVLAKFSPSDLTESSRAEAALNRALELSPDLSIADHFYAQLEVERGRAANAMARLVRRASGRATDPELFAALVTACRYCGLLDASLAAHQRARRLDPNVRTSVQHTLLMLQDYRGAALHHDPGVDFGWLALACAGDHDAAAERYSRTVKMTGDERQRAVFEGWLAILRGTGPLAALEAANAAIEATLGSFRDPEGIFYNALCLARGGDQDRAVDILARVVERGFFPYSTFTTHPWFDPLRQREDFRRVVEQAEEKHREARAAFIEAGGEAVLGVDETRA